MHPKIIRRIKKLEVETGKKTWKELKAYPVWDFKNPMDPMERKRNICKALTKNKSEFDDAGCDGMVQYRLHSRADDVSDTACINSAMCLM